jgi:hypothetical protein
VRTFVPEGLSESNPARSAGLAFLKSIRPGLSAIVRTTTEERDDRQMLAIAEPRAKPKAECFYRPLPRKLISVFGVEGRTCLFTSFPSTSYWATFAESLRDNSSPYNPKPLMLTQMGSRPTVEGNDVIRSKAENRYPSSG